MIRRIFADRKDRWDLATKFVAGRPLAHDRHEGRVMITPGGVDGRDETECPVKAGREPNRKMASYYPMLRFGSEVEIDRVRTESLPIS